MDRQQHSEGAAGRNGAMTTQEHEQPPGPTYCDRIAAELRRLRDEVGNPSFAEVARRVTATRVATGATPEAARIARTTIYDAFRDGRKRIDLDLHREIAAALGAQPDEVEEWLLRARVEPAAVEPVAEDPAGGGQTSAAGTVPTEEEPPAQPSVDGPTTTVGWRGALALMLVCLAVNMVGREVVTALTLSTHLDMIGTAVVALALGPWRGAAVGLATNLLGALTLGVVSLPFALVNVVGALVWGYGVRAGLGRTLPRFLALNLAVAVACSAVAVPILLALYGGSVHHGQDGLVGQLLDHMNSVVAVAAANLMTSVADKLLSGFVALAVVAALPVAFRRGRGLALTEVDASASVREG